MIKEQLETVESNICRACSKSKRNREEVTLIAVSKTKPVEDLKEAYACGIRYFGENKVQEIMDKYPQMPADVKWHMIGHLQTNKVKYIVDKVYLIHSVDSLKLAQEISRQAEKKNIVVSVLIEVNVAGEETKFGIAPEEAETIIRDMAALPGILIRGLMTIAPYTDNPEDNRQYFTRLKQLSVDIAEKNIDNVNMDVLSMGMTGDYAVAIEEGAAFVRIGTGIFGERESGLLRFK